LMFSLEIISICILQNLIIFICVIIIFHLNFSIKLTAWN